MMVAMKRHVLVLGVTAIALVGLSPVLRSSPVPQIDGPWGLPLDIMADFLVAAGTSSEDDEGIESLQGGAHDPNKRGFTLQQLELGLFGEFDPFEDNDIVFGAAAFALFTEESVELEEAFVTVNTANELPFSLEFEVGHFYTEFGRINPLHPHAWDWVDQNFIVTRMFGGEGMRGVGFRTAIATKDGGPFNAKLHFGMQDAYGETMSSFGGEFGGHGHGDEEEEEEEELGGGVGNRPLIERERKSFDDFVYLVRAEMEARAGETIDIAFGGSVLFGPNRTGAKASTTIWGVDTRLTFWTKPGDDARVMGDIQAEYIHRQYKTDAFFDELDAADPTDDVSLASDTLDDSGFYIQGRYWLSPEWAIGLRFESASSDGQSFDLHDGGLIDVDEDNMRNDRFRVSPLLMYQPSGAVRIRLQYNYDEADHLSDNSASSVWLSFEWTLSTAE